MVQTTHLVADRATKTGGGLRDAAYEIAIERVTAALLAAGI
jgi:glutamate dehydrogenase/leucine dehydrogenase